MSSIDGASTPVVASAVFAGGPPGAVPWLIARPTSASASASASASRSTDAAWGHCARSAGPQSRPTVTEGHFRPAKYLHSSTNDLPGGDPAVWYTHGVRYTARSADHGSIVELCRSRRRWQTSVSAGGRPACPQVADQHVRRWQTSVSAGVRPGCGTAPRSARRSSTTRTARPRAGVPPAPSRPRGRDRRSRH